MKIRKRFVIGIAFSAIFLLGANNVAANSKVYKEKTESVGYHWGSGGPNGWKDNYTAIFDQSQYLDKKDYFIQTLADDGIVMEVDGKKIIDRPKYSWDSLVNRALLRNLTPKEYNIKTTYYEGKHNAVVYSDIVPFGDWLAYYYNNENFAGQPIASKVIKANSDGDLVELNWQNSPVPGKVNKDHFSAKYVTAKKIPAGQYVINLGADDGAQVYIDGKLVLDRFTPRGYREDAVKVDIKNNSGADGDVHWIEIRYKEGVLSSRVKFSMRPYSEFINIKPEDGWVGEVYANDTFKGTPLLLGSKLFGNPIHELDLNWGAKSPSPLIPNDHFSAIFHRKLDIPETGVYRIKVWADDKVRLYIDGTRVIDSWKYIPGSYREIEIPLSKGIRDVKLEYAEGILNSRVKFDIEKVDVQFSAKANSLSYNWGQGGPNGLKDNFYAKFDQSQHLDAGDYFIQTRADDGLFLEVNGNKKIDRWYYSSNTIDRSLLLNAKAGNHQITTLYREGTLAANIFSDVVKFGDWLAYYFPNQTVSGAPVASKVIKQQGKYGALLEVNGTDSPVPGKVPADKFSALYVTAKRIKAGDYVLRTGADDGVQVLIDGKVVLDRFTNGSFREDSIKLSIKDNPNAPSGEKDIHWIEVRYQENILASRINVFLQPYAEAINVSEADGWVGEFYSNKDLKGTPVIMGGKDAIQPIKTLNYSWGNNSPSPLLPKDNFSAKFTKKLIVPQGQAGKYRFSVTADDGVIVEVIDKKGNKQTVINSWKYLASKVRENIVHLDEGEYSVVVKYYDGKLAATLKASIEWLPVIHHTTTYNYPFSKLVDAQMTGDRAKWDSAGKIPATREQVEYYANPSNFPKGSTGYYQFLVLSKPVGLNAKEVNEKILNNKGNLSGQAQAFIDAGKKYNINEAYLIAHALHETGNGKSTLANGIPVDKNGKVTRDAKGNMAHTSQTAHVVYNMYGYGAYDSCPLDCGAKYAFDKGWFSQADSIIGGAQQIYSYISRGQDTLYKMKWNPASPGYPQYATHIMWATAQTTRIAEIYNLLDSYSMEFDVPKFQSQPPASELPDEGPILEVIVDNLNIRTQPNTSATRLAQVHTGATLTPVLDKNNKIIRQNEWYQIMYDGQEAWVSGGTGGTEYIKVK